MALVRTARGIIAGRYVPWLIEIARLSCPTLIVWGSEDPVIPVGHAYKFQGSMTHAELCVVPSCGHVPQEEVPHIVGPRIAKFLTAG